MAAASVRHFNEIFRTIWDTVQTTASQGPGHDNPRGYLKKYAALSFSSRSYAESRHPRRVLLGKYGTCRHDLRRHQACGVP